MRTETDIQKLTAVAIRKYVKSGGVRCPFCGGEDIVGESVDIEAGSAYQDVHCDAEGCGARWTDTYKLVGVI